MQTLFRALFSVLLAVTVLLTGCTSQTAENSAASPTETAAATPSTPASVASSPSAEFSNLPRLEGGATVEMTVKDNKITMQIDGANAPITAGNFVDLVNRGVYDGLVFHRVVRQPQPFVVQGGDPQSKDPSFPVSQLGTGSFIDPATSEPRYIPLEIKPAGADSPVYGEPINQTPALQHKKGALAMARSQLPNSASSQFYIALADLDFLDGSYAVFGYVTQGMETVDQIQQGDRIESARVVSGLENLKTATANPSTTPSP